MTKKALWIVVGLLALVITCLCISATIGFIKGVVMFPAYSAERTVIDQQVCEPAVITQTCDPSAVPFTDMGELDPNVETVINGPAIYEWWTGGVDEGVQRVDVGETVTIHGSAGHWWTLPNQQGLDCVWDLHVRNYGAKPQHKGKTNEQLVVSPPAEYLE